MPSVRVRENEYFDAALRRFKRACEKAGVLTELRRREFYEKPTQERKRKKAAAVKRHLKRLSRENMRGTGGGAPASTAGGCSSRPTLLGCPSIPRSSVSLKERITDDMKAAMRSGEKERLGVIRMITAAIKQREVDERITLDDAQVLDRARENDQAAQGIAGAVPGRQSPGSGRQGNRGDHPAADLPARAAERRRNRCVDRRGDRRHRRHQHQGHGQGHGHHQGQGAGAGRHGRRRAPRSKPSSAVDRAPVHGRPHPTAVHRRDRRALGHRRDHRRAACRSKNPAANTRPAARSTARNALLLGQSRQAVLSLLRLRRARHRGRLSHAVREDGIPRCGRGPRAARGTRTAARGAGRARSRQRRSVRSDGPRLAFLRAKPRG